MLKILYVCMIIPAVILYLTLVVNLIILLITSLIERNNL